MDPQAIENDPHEWPDSALLSARDLVTMLGNGTTVVRACNDFPPPARIEGDRPGRPYWTVGAVREWENTHCSYGSSVNRCTARLDPDTDHFGLCPTHREQALPIIEWEKYRHVTVARS